MRMILDFLLLAASGVACLYCWVLSRRLKALANAEKGLGAGISQLTSSAEEMKSAIAATKAGADAAANKLETLLVRAEQKAAELAAMFTQIDAASDSVAEKTENATRKYVDTLTPFLAEASEVADRLFQAIEHGRPQPPADDGLETAYLDPVEQAPAEAAGGRS